MSMQSLKEKSWLLAFPVLVTAQACSVPFFSSGGTFGVWRSIDGGDTFQQVSQLEGGGKQQSFGNVSVASIVVIPNTNPRVVFAASPVAGVFKTENGAATWKKVLDGAQIVSLALDSRSPETLFAAGRSSGHGRIFRTTDSGGTWQEVYTDPGQNTVVTALLIDEDRSETIYAGLSTGAFLRSEDSGSSWEKLADFPDSIKKITTDSGKLLLLLEGRGLRESSDGGRTWQDISLGTQERSEFFSPFQSASLFNDFALGSDNRMLVGSAEGVFLASGGSIRKLSLPSNVPGPVQAVALTNDRLPLLFAGVGNILMRSRDSGRNWRTITVRSAGNIRTISIDPNDTRVIYLGIDNR
jgi:photosystem II stability/assembly factor-like uncharacterized protein